MKKVIFLLFLGVSQTLYSAEEVYASKPFHAKENGVFLTMAELNEIKEKVESGEKNGKLVGEYKKLVEEFKKLNAIDEKLLSDYNSLEQYRKQAIELYQMSVKQYQESTKLMVEVNESLHKKMNSERSRSRWQRNLNFIAGFMMPLIGAKAINIIK